jgi:hypothetical protein
MGVKLIILLWLHKQCLSSRYAAGITRESREQGCTQTKCLKRLTWKSSTPGVMAHWYSPFWDPGTSKTVLDSNPVECTPLGLKLLPALCQWAWLGAQSKSLVLRFNICPEEELTICNENLDPLTVVIVLVTHHIIIQAPLKYLVAIGLKASLLLYECHLYWSLTWHWWLHTLMHWRRGPMFENSTGPGILQHTMNS